MKQLLYVWIDSILNRALIRKQGIQISNDYIVTPQLHPDILTLTGISIDENPDNIYKDFFGKNIININTLVGINGVGKTSVIELLASVRTIRKRHKYDWQYFILYQVDDYYILEGCDFNVVEDIIIDVPDRSIINDEYSIICKYDSRRKKFIFVDLCSASSPISKSISYYYYMDRSNASLHELYGQETSYEDSPICFKRNKLYLNYAQFYKLITDSNLTQHINLQHKLNSFSFTIMPRKELFFQYDASDQNSASPKELFIINILYLMNKRYTQNIPGIDVDEDNTIKYIPYRYQEYVKALISGYEAYREFSNIDINKVLVYLENIPAEHFSSPSSFIQMDRKLVLPGNEFISDAYELLSLLAPIVSEIFNITCTNISAGQKKILDVYTSLYSAITAGNNTLLSQNESTKIIVLDEPEKGFHPEMSRKFISTLVDVFNTLPNSKVKYQFIITSHSPIMISDIPLPFVHCMDYVTVNGEVTALTEIKTTKMGLLNNIADITKDTFFLKSPFGEYSEKYFEELQNAIKSLGAMTSQSAIEAKERIRMLQLKINDITDPTLNKFLQRELERKLSDILQKDELINYYEQKIQELKQL